MIRSKVQLIIFSLIIFFSAKQVAAQNWYNVGIFSIWVPAGWELISQDDDSIIINFTEGSFVLSFYAVDEDELEIKQKAIIRSLQKTYNFAGEASDKGEMNLDNGLNIAYLSDVIMTINGNEKSKFIWAQVNNAQDYILVIFGICSFSNFQSYKSTFPDAWKHSVSS